MDLSEMYAGMRYLFRRMGNMLSVAVVVITDTSQGFQRLQALGRADEVHEDLLHFLPYGIAFRVKAKSADGKGAETVVLRIDADRGICLPAIDRRFKPPVDLVEGEVIIYDDLGQMIHLHRDGITVKTGKVLRLEGDEVRVHATSRLLLDVHGYAQEIVHDHAANTWQVNDFKTPSPPETILPGVSNPINDPEVP